MDPWGQQHTALDARDRADRCRAVARALAGLAARLSDGLSDCVRALDRDAWSSPAAELRRQELVEASGRTRACAASLEDLVGRLHRRARRWDAVAEQAWIRAGAAYPGSGSPVPLGAPADDLS